jgi:ABC-type microcin C transport system duplicated ATPase subunit YejF
MAAPNIPQERLASRDRLLFRLNEIESTARKYSIYNLSTPLDVSVFKNALLDSSYTKEDLAVNLLEPYITSLESRHSAIAEIFHTIDRFISILNSFFSGKSITYDTSRGFVIRNEKTGRDLNPSMLSSGEQQLLLLFCYVLLSTDQPSVFIIDEPEISLNIKWQRKLVQSLLDVAQAGNVQFILASHSMELLAQHRRRVVPIVNRSFHE